jgi:hypothetical protein
MDNKPVVGIVKVLGHFLLFCCLARKEKTTRHNIFLEWRPDVESAELVENTHLTQLKLIHPKLNRASFNLHFYKTNHTPQSSQQPSYYHIISCKQLHFTLTMSATPFRSHLMQQWARSNQARPPISVVPWLKRQQQGNQPAQQVGEDERQKDGSSADGWSHPSLSSINTTQSYSSSSPASTSWKQHAAVSSAPAASIPTRSTTGTGVRNLTVSSAMLLPEESSLSTSDSRGEKGEKNYDDSPLLARSFQTLLQNHQASTKFKPTRSSNSSSSSLAKDASIALMMAALERACQCATMTPKYNRIEQEASSSWTITRLLAPSPDTMRLADIAYHMTFARDSRESKSVQSAQRKRAKWLGIPAFLVTLVHDNQSAQAALVDDDNSDQACYYEPLPFAPHETEQQLEDVSETCENGSVVYRYYAGAYQISFVLIFFCFFDIVSLHHSMPMPLLQFKR